MSQHDLDKHITTAAQILRQAKRAVALTGAGISTPSGIPDFRSTDSGLWEKHDPMIVASLYGFQQQPEAFYDWVRPLSRLTAEAAPNPAHFALRDLEKMGILNSIITQNIDILHTRAGSQTVYEVHGHMREMECLSCGVTADAEPVMKAFVDQNQLPRCIACGAITKPKVILFGELLPAEILHGAQQAAASCDVMIVIGSSLEVAPINSLPRIALQNGAKLIIINFGPTHIDSAADVIIRGDVATVLPRIVQLVQN